jgi:SAM-dependent methyltransferase
LHKRNRYPGEHATGDNARFAALGLAGFARNVLFPPVPSGVAMKHLFSRLLISLAAVCATAFITAPAMAQNEELDTPYVTTPQNVVDAMLGLAGVKPGDTLLDLGSGDGRIVVTAAQRFGVKGTGIEIDPRLIKLARENAQKAGVADKATFREQDLFTTDLSGYSVITIYLLPDVNKKLKPALQKLKPGTRIVSHDWGMGDDWIPEKVVVVPAPEKKVGLEKTSKLMLWTVR